MSLDGPQQMLDWTQGFILCETLTQGPTLHNGDLEVAGYRVGSLRISNISSGG